MQKRQITLNGNVTLSDLKKKKKKQNKKKLTKNNHTLLLCRFDAVKPIGWQFSQLQFTGTIVKDKQHFVKLNFEEQGTV